MTLHDELAQHYITAAARLQANRAAVLRESGLPSGLAVLCLPLLEHLRQHPDPGEVSDLLGDLVGKEQRRALLAVLNHPATALHALAEGTPLHAACQALSSALGGSDVALQADTVKVAVRTGPNSSVSDIRVLNPARDLIYHEAPPDPQQPNRTQALISYLRRMQTDCRALQLGGIDQTEARNRSSLHLERVYIQLHVERQVALSAEELAASPKDQMDLLTREMHALVEVSAASPEDLRQRVHGAGVEQPMRPLTALEALGSSSARARPRTDRNGRSRLPTASDGALRLMLLGDPGSGKSTFVNHLVLTLGGATLCRQVANEPQPADGWLALLPAWELGERLPVRIILRQLADYAPLLTSSRGSIAALRDFLRDVALGAQQAALPEIEAALTSGQALLLFDGLDEVVGEPTLSRVVEMIQDAAGTYTRCPILVTCRVLDYRANPRRQLRDFQVETLAGLTDEQIQTFVAAWYAELATTGRQMLGTTVGLQQALAARSELRALARLPLLLTMIVIVHSGRGSLPDARALLYAECIDLLLLRWRQEEGQPDVLTKLNLPSFRANDLLALMARVGFTAHNQAEREGAADGPVALRLAQIRELFEETFQIYTNEDRRRDELVSILLHEIVTRNGLLLKQNGEQGEAYAFPHRTFQEFLAGYHLKGHKYYYRECTAMATKLHWHEALSLMVSYQVLSDDELEKPLKLVEELLAAGPLAQVLAGELANLIGRERAARYDPTLIRSDRLWGKLRHVLLAILIRGQSPITLAALRVRAGFAHSTLSYGDVATLAAGDMPLLPDARLPLSVLGASAASHPRWPDMLKRYWLPIEPGPFWFGDDRKGTLRQQSINTAYKVARFPITNADYARFMADQGYQNQHWWARQGWAFLQKRLITMPHYWQDAGYNSPTQPVVGVSWYESAAYCRWLTAQGHIQGWLPKADTIRLPTALEWERAARHTDKRVYPWGQAKPNLELANYATEIGSPSPVGCFPFGRALCGAEELAGNVWEWLVTPDQKDTQVKPIDDPAANEEVLFTGGWYGTDKIELMYCGARFGEFPGFRHFNHGFRIVWSLSSSDSV